MRILIEVREGLNRKCFGPTDALRPTHWTDYFWGGMLCNRHDVVAINYTREKWNGKPYQSVISPDAAKPDVDLELMMVGRNAVIDMGRGRDVAVFGYNLGLSCTRLWPDIMATVAKAAVVMTEEQKVTLEKRLPDTPVVKVTPGVDADYIQNLARNLPPPENPTPFALIAGDNGRSVDDIMAISRGLHKYKVVWSVPSAHSVDILKGNAWPANLRIVCMPSTHEYLALLVKASVFLCPVTATNHPAGWTACAESFAAGVPVVMYDGLAAREFERLGIHAHVTMPGNVELVTAIAKMYLEDREMEDANVAVGALNIYRNCDDFLKRLENVL